MVYHQLAKSFDSNLKMNRAICTYILKKVLKY